MRYVNEHFFDNWSPHAAWCLGLIFTDGCIGHSNGRKYINLVNTDREMLSKFTKFLDSNYTISKQTFAGNRKDVFSVKIYNDKLYDRLVELGLTERKSLTLCFPSCIPDNYVSDFIRGCWDGDGGIYQYEGNRGYYLMCKLTTCSERFAIGTVDAIYSNTGVDVSLEVEDMFQLNDTIKKSFRIRCVSKKAELLCKMMYHNNMGEAFLSRKRDVWIAHTKRNI